MRIRKRFKNIGLYILYDFEDINDYVLGLILFVFTIIVLSDGWSLKHVGSLHPEIYKSVVNPFKIFIEYYGLAIYKHIVIFIIVSGLFTSLILVKPIKDRSLMTLLTYPVERLEIIMSKYLSNFFIIIILLYIPHVIDTMLVKLDILSIFYIFIALIPITIYTVSLSFLLGVITRNEVLTILGLYVIYSGINRIIGVFDSELGAKILNWYIMIFDLHSFSFGIEFLLGIMYWIVSPIFLAVISMIYFAYMEFD